MVLSDKTRRRKRTITWKCAQCEHKETVKKHKGESLSETCPECGILGFRYPVNDTNR